MENDRVRRRQNLGPSTADKPRQKEGEELTMHDQVACRISVDPVGRGTRISIGSVYAPA